ncbi:hypothetical protein CAXC1_260030 [Candidatus Xenohaliotis californiensis]|uniref:Uncharacterized protein n=1 Tax=Candidatus Xenohaliotis californiensis TaxID=84677 RepID=A0ABM9N847_9RICK|nr:hypothetical protein CAXC1_260030 [Candidatus Xenohaliotis californiensis]
MSNGLALKNILDNHKTKKFVTNHLLNKLKTRTQNTHITY